MRNGKAARNVREIQKDLAMVVEDMAAIRRHLRLLQNETEQTPSYRFSQQCELGEPDASEITLRWMLVGVIAEAVGSLDDLAYGLLHAKRMDWTEADRSLLRPIKVNA